jgi:3-phosphoshikimate 1-carboxyvinyltransferase
MLAAIAEGRSRIQGFASSADCASTLECLRSLGASIAREGDAVCIDGRGVSSFKESGEMLDCGNSGSTMRMLSGILAGQPFVSTLTGDDSLRSRPMRRIIEPLEMMGARIIATEGRAPLRVEGRNPLRAIRYETPVASAQVKSCVLLAGLFADGRTEVIERMGTTRDHTERMLRWFGVDVETFSRESDNAPGVALIGPSELSARYVSVPGDISSAAFFIVAGALLNDSDLLIENVGLNPSRAEIIEVVRSVGVKVEIEDEREECNEPVGNIRIRGTGTVGGADGPTVLDGAVIAQIIDEIPILSVLGTQVEGGFTVRNAKELRVKESDRIATMVENLRKMGAEVEEFDDGLSILGPVKLKGAHLKAYGDHRIAMACSVAALIADGDSEIEGAECVAVSFPEFYELLGKVAVS